MQWCCIKYSCIVSNKFILCQIQLYYISNAVTYQIQSHCIVSNTVAWRCFKYSTVVLYCWFENNSDNMIEQNGQKESWWQV